MGIYLDNSTATRPYREVIETVSECMDKLYANPSSIYLTRESESNNFFMKGTVNKGNLSWSEKNVI